MRDILERIAHALEALAAKGGVVFPPHTPSFPSSSEELTSSLEEKSSLGKSETPFLPVTTKRVRKPRAIPVPDDAWLDSLAADPAYKGIDVHGSAARCRVWCENKGKVFSKGRVIAWLNREERPLQVGALVPQVKEVIPPMPPANDPIARGLWRRTYGHLLEKKEG